MGAWGPTVSVWGMGAAAAACRAMTRRRPSPDDRVVVAAGSGWRLEWPIGLWAAMTDDARREVVDRQAALLRKGNDRVTI